MGRHGPRLSDRIRRDGMFVGFFCQAIPCWSRGRVCRSRPDELASLLKLWSSVRHRRRSGGILHRMARRQDLYERPGLALLQETPSSGRPRVLQKMSGKTIIMARFVPLFEPFARPSGAAKMITRVPSLRHRRRIRLGLGNDAARLHPRPHRPHQ